MDGGLAEAGPSEIPQLDLDGLQRRVENLDEDDWVNEVITFGRSLNTCRVYWDRERQRMEAVYSGLNCMLGTSSIQEQKNKARIEELRGLLQLILPPHHRRDPVRECHQLMARTWPRQYDTRYWCQPRVRMGKRMAQALVTLAYTCQLKGVTYQRMQAALRVAVFIRRLKTGQGIDHKLTVSPIDVRQADSYFKTGRLRRTPSAAELQAARLGLDAQGFLVSIDDGGQFVAAWPQLEDARILEIDMP